MNDLIDLWDNMKWFNTFVTRVPEGKEMKEKWQKMQE